MGTLYKHTRAFISECHTIKCSRAVYIAESIKFEKLIKISTLTEVVFNKLNILWSLLKTKIIMLTTNKVN